MQNSVNNAKEFMCIRNGDIIKVRGFGSSAFGKYKALLDSQLGEIPKVLVKSLQEDQKNELPLFLYYVESDEGTRMLTDETLSTACRIENEKLEIIVEC